MPQPVLADLGWSAYFLHQLAPDEIGRLIPARLTAIHRDRVDAISVDGPLRLTLPNGLSTGEVAVGDWVLAEAGRVNRVLDRETVLSRWAAGTSETRQLIAANLQTLAIVTSCTDEFNAGRLERFLALARSGGVAPLIVLTKADITDPAPYIKAAGAVAMGAPVLALDGRDPNAAAVLLPWCGRGQTLGLVGSSGVGKSTLAGSLAGLVLDTGPVREHDSRGRHTTTARFLLPLASGGWLIDTPGMRELRLDDAGAGIVAAFDDITTLAAGCRFSNCTHAAEPGCAVQAAIAAGDMQPDRLARWMKLLREDRAVTTPRHEAHARNRAFGKLARKATQAKRARWGEAED